MGVLPCAAVLKVSPSSDAVAVAAAAAVVDRCFLAIGSELSMLHSADTPQEDAPRTNARRALLPLANTGIVVIDSWLEDKERTSRHVRRRRSRITSKQTPSLTLWRRWSRSWMLMLLAPPLLLLFFVFVTLFAFSGAAISVEEEEDEEDESLRSRA